MAKMIPKHIRKKMKLACDIDLRYDYKMFSRALQRNQDINNAFYGQMSINISSVDPDGILEPLELFIMTRTQNRRLLKEIAAQRIIDKQNEVRSCLKELLS